MTANKVNALKPMLSKTAKAMAKNWNHKVIYGQKIIFFLFITQFCYHVQAHLQPMTTLCGFLILEIVSLQSEDYTQHHKV